MKINYLSDFKVRLQPTVGGEPVDITGHDFRIVFGTTGGTRRYECGQSGGVLTNCTLDGTAIVCVLDNHRLSVGSLIAQVYDYAPDASYPDGNELTVTPSELDVTLVTGAGDGSQVDAEVAADISVAVATAKQAASDAAASADDADNAAVLARAAQVAAEDAAERAAQVGGYTKAEADALLAGKANVNGNKGNVFAVSSLMIGDYTQIRQNAPTIEVANSIEGGGGVVSFPYDKSGTIALTSDIPDTYTKAEADALLAGKADKAELNEVEDALHDAVLDVSGRVDNKAEKPLVVNVTLDDGQDDAQPIKQLKADKTATEIYNAIQNGKAVVAHMAGGILNEEAWFTLDLSMQSMALFTSNYGALMTMIVESDGTCLFTNIENALQEDLQAAEDDIAANATAITALQSAKADKVDVVDVTGTTVTQELTPNTFYRFATVDALTLTLGAAPSGELAIYACSFVAASDATTLTLPASVTGDAPTIAAGHRYELNILDNILIYTEYGND